MGIIEGGCVSGLLPNDRVFAVNFPGYPNSLERATQALGGEDRIGETRSAEGNYLELKFRPEDPCAHAAFGELSPTSDLLLRIRRKRCKSVLRSKEAGEGLNSGAGDTPTEDNAENFETCADIVARVEQSYNFDGMADYQYVLSVHADVARRRQKREREKIGFGNLMDVEQDELMMLVPPLFSIKDMPEETANLMPCFAVDFKILEVPAILKWEGQLVRDSMEFNLTAATVRLFEERPIWAKPTLLDRLADFGVVIADAHVKRLLFRTGYYFGYGPFRTLWIRNGYDPRRDPESRLYQMMDFRIPRTVKDIGSGPKRPISKDSGPAWRDICSFKAAPVKKCSFLQLFDLQDDYIQEQIRKPAERPSCNEFTGWFSRITLDQLRDHIRARFMGLMPDELARELQGLPRTSWAPSLKTVTWKDNEDADPDIDLPGPPYDRAPAPATHVDERDDAGIGIQTPSELTFTPLPDSHSLEEPNPEPEPEPDPEIEPEIENETEIAVPEVDLEADAAVAAEMQAEEEEEEESDDDEEEEEEEEEEEDEAEEEEEEEEEMLPQSHDGDLQADDMPDSFLKELLKKFPFGEDDEVEGGDEDDAEYAIYEQADDEDED